MNLVLCLDHQPSIENDDDGDNNVCDKSDGVNKNTSAPPGDFYCLEGVTVSITDVGALIQVLCLLENRFFDGNVTEMKNDGNNLVPYDDDDVEIFD